MALEPGPTTDRPSAMKFDRWVDHATLAHGASTGVPALVSLPSKRSASTGALLRLEHLHPSDEEQIKQLHALISLSRCPTWHYLDTVVFPKTMKCVRWPPVLRPRICGALCECLTLHAVSYQVSSHETNSQRLRPWWRRVIRCPGGFQWHPSEPAP